MVKALFFNNTKSFLVLTIIIILVMFIYSSMSVVMFDPDDAAKVQGIVQTMPNSLISALGFDDIGTTLTGFVASIFYGFIIAMFSMIYSILVSHGLVSKLADNGSIAFLLATPNTRKSIVGTQIIFFITCLTIIVWLPFFLILVMSASLLPGVLEILLVLKLSIIAYLVVLAVGGISFVCSCIFSDAKYSLAFGAGIPTFFLIMNFIQGIDKSVEWVKFLSLYSFLDINLIMASDTYVWTAGIILAILSVILYTLAIMIFDRKNFIV